MIIITLKHLRCVNAILGLPSTPLWLQSTPIADIFNTADTTIIGLTNTIDFSRVTEGKGGDVPKLVDSGTAIHPS